MTQYIEKDFVISKMKRWLVAALVFGILFGAAYCYDYNMRLQRSRNADYDDRLLMSNYDGDYLSYPETARFAIYDIKIKDDVMEDLIEDPAFNFLNYVYQYGSVIVERLNSEYNRQAMYINLKNSLEFDLSRFPSFAFNDVFGGAFLYSSQTLGIKVMAPFDYQWTLGLSDEQMVFVRDTVFSLYTSLLDDDQYYADLPVYLVRVNPEIEESMSEQTLIYSVLRESGEAGAAKIVFPKKRMFFCFAVGFVLVELIAMLVAVLDDRVKSVKELKSRTDLVLISVTNEAEIEAYREEAGGQNGGAGKGTAYLYARSLSADLAAKIADYMKTKFGWKNVIFMQDDLLLEDKKTLDEDVRIVIPVEIMRTKFGELEVLAEQLNPYGVEIQAIVLQK